jgi:TonB family protein
MSAAPSLVFEDAPRRAFLRHPISVPVDVIVLRSGVPENLPGRCTDLSEIGVGAVVAGQLGAGQQVAVELRLPNVGVPLRARAVVRYQSRLRCGIEFVGLSINQREMIRYWLLRTCMEPANVAEGNFPPAQAEALALAMQPVAKAKISRRIRIGRRRLYLLIASILVLAGMVWWQWQRSWSELENRAPIGKSGLRVSSEIMGKRILEKIEPMYPEIARTNGTEGLVVLDAVISPDGSVERLQTLSGPDPLAQSATEAVRFWKFEPYLSSGKAVEVETTIAVEFRLN